MSRRLVRATTEQGSPLCNPSVASLSTCLNLPLRPRPPNACAAHIGEKLRRWEGRERRKGREGREDRKGRKRRKGRQGREREKRSGKNKVCKERAAVSSRSLRQTLCGLCVETRRVQNVRIAGESREAGGGGSRRSLPPVGVDLSRRVEERALARAYGVASQPSLRTLRVLRRISAPYQTNFQADGERSAV